MNEIIRAVRDDLRVTRSEAELIVASLLERPRFSLYFNGAMDDETMMVLRMRLKQYKNGVPLEYLTKKIQFLDMDLKINPGVFIPRLETEYFVNLVEQKISVAPRTILEIGTGCGAIALGLARAYPDAFITATDISERALTNARENIAVQNRSENIALVRSDRFTGIKDKFDLIISNPPYIPSGRIRSLPESVKGFEPVSALAGGRSGIEFIKKLITEGLMFLEAAGMLALEIDEEEKLPLEDYLATSSLHCVFEKDLFGCVRYLFIRGRQ